ncbi:MAG: RusA family crossover junction endodeoxyribonuclease [Candidatus Babeliales bacterium]
MKQTFRYDGIPKAQGRPKFFRRGNFVGAYDPKDSRQYKDNIAAQIVAQKPVLIDREKAIKIWLSFYLPRPKGHYNSKGIIKPQYASSAHTKKPDLDNMVKAVKDSLKGILWYDDSQVCFTEAEKKYSDKATVYIIVEDL